MTQRDERRATYGASRLVATALLVVIVVAGVYGAGRRAIGTTQMSSDEATSILAAREVLSHGLPLVPSQQIYYRSPLSHYLDAVSIAIIGDSELGWRGASITAYGLLLLLPGLVLLVRRYALLAPLWAGVVGLMVPLQRIASSARMYMVYTLLATMAVVIAVFWRPSKWDKRGVLYVVVCALMAFAHEHCVVFVPGLLLCAIVIQSPSSARALLRGLRRPLIVGPTISVGIAVLWHFGDVGGFLPNAFANVTSNPTALGASRSFLYPLRVLSEFPVAPAILLMVSVSWVVLMRRARPTPTLEATCLVLVVLTAYGSVSWMLPAQAPYYVTPLLPLFCLAVVACAVSETATLSTWSIRARWGVAIAFVLFVAVVQVQSPSPFWNLSDSWRAATERLPTTQHEKWIRLRDFAKKTNAMVITSEPEIVFLRIGQIVAHVRTAGVRASSPCAEVMDDYQPTPFAHHPCQLSRLLDQATAASVPLLFIGGRLGSSIGPESTQYIRDNLIAVGKVDQLSIYCAGKACQTLVN